MRLTLYGLTILPLVCASAAGAGDSSAASRAAAVAQAERKLPWFWSPSAEGLADISYTYEERMSRRILDRHGNDVPPDFKGNGLTNWRSLRFERIPLEFGSFLRCVSQDGASPCSSEWDQELERQIRRRDEMSSEERARIEQTREQRRERRRAFWDRFPAAMSFEATGAGQIRFTSKAKSGHDLLDALSGQLWFDAATNEITAMEYELTRDVDDVLLRRPKGTRFRIELRKGADGRYLPSKIWSCQQAAKSGESEEGTAEFSNFRRFGAESTIEFGDSEPPLKP